MERFGPGGPHIQNDLLTKLRLGHALGGRVKTYKRKGDIVHNITINEHDDDNDCPIIPAASRSHS